MAAPQPIALEQEKYEKLSELYLTLWKQMDLICSEGKWLEMRPADQNDLRKTAGRIVQQLQSHLPAAELTLDVINKDFSKAQDCVERVAQVEKNELETFKDYLRDNALRLSHLACGDA